jgi:YVTN family beta-propeller protein
MSRSALLVLVVCIAACAGVSSASADGCLVVANGTTVCCLAIDTLTPQWCSDVGFPIGTVGVMPAPQRPIVLVGAADGAHSAAFDCVTGAHLWTFDGAGLHTLASDIYGRYYTDTARYPYGPPNLGGGPDPDILLLSPGTSPWTTYLVDAGTGAVICQWDVLPDGTRGFQFLPTASGGYDIVFSSESANMLRVNGADCSDIVWSRALHRRWGAPVPDVNGDGQPDFFAEPSYYDETVHMLNGADGTDLWTTSYCAFDVIGGVVIQDALGCGVIASAQLSCAGGVRRYRCDDGSVVWDGSTMYNNNTLVGLLPRGDGMTVVSGWRFQNEAIGLDSATGVALWDNIPISDGDYVGIGVSDLTGDGNDDFLALSEGFFRLYDGVTGTEQTWFAPIPGTAAAYVSTASSGCTVYKLGGVFPATGCTSLGFLNGGDTLFARDTWSTYDTGYSFYDTATREYLGECHVPGTVWAGATSADDAHIWTSRYYGGYVTEISPTDCAWGCDLNVGSWTDDVMFDNARHYLWVGENDPGNGAIGSVRVVDTGSCSVMATVPLNGEPGHFAKAAGDDFFYITTRNSGTERLYKIDGTTWAVAGTLDLPGIRDAGLSIAPDGTRAYVPNISAGFIYVVDTASMTVFASWPVESEPGASSWGFYVEPQGLYAILLSGGTEIGVFSLAHQTVIQRINVGGTIEFGKNRPLWSADGSTAYLPLSSLSGVYTLVRSSSAGDPCVRLGDLNCDGGVDFGDINPFVMYLSQYGVWRNTYPDCDPLVGDINGDGTYPSFEDINPFVALLTRDR